MNFFTRIIYLFVLGLGIYMPLVHMERSQKGACKRLFSPSTEWVPGSGCQTWSPYLLSHLTSSET